MALQAPGSVRQPSPPLLMHPPCQVSKIASAAAQAVPAAQEGAWNIHEIPVDGIQVRGLALPTILQTEFKVLQAREVTVILAQQTPGVRCLALPMILCAARWRPGASLVGSHRHCRQCSGEAVTVCVFPMLCRLPLYTQNRRLPFPSRAARCRALGSPYRVWWLTWPMPRCGASAAWRRQWRRSRR